MTGYTWGGASGTNWWVDPKADLAVVWMASSPGAPGSRQCRRLVTAHTAATAMHPIGGCERGWSKVKGPWAQVASLSTGGKVTLKSARINATKDMAVESGVEVGTAIMAGTTIAINDRVTNVYVRTGRVWKIVHHHTDVSPEMVAVLQRLQRGGA